MNVKQALIPGNYTFGNGTSDPLYYIGTFNSLSGPGTEHNWQLGDSTKTGETVSKIFAANKTYTVAVNSKKGCDVSFDKVFKVGNPLQTNITAINLSGTKYSFSATTGTDEPYSYQWSFGDNIGTSNLRNPEYTYSSASVTYYAVLTLKDGAGNTCVSKYLIVPNGASGSCATNPNFMSNFTPVANTKALSNITLLIKDSKGHVYSSNDIQQLSDSKFQIVSVEDYDVNENGDKTKKIKINFSCKVKDGNDVISITNGEAVIAAAYK